MLYSKKIYTHFLEHIKKPRRRRPERFLKFVKNKLITIIDINVQQMVQRKETVEETVKTRVFAFGGTSSQTKRKLARR
jgi:hypothetical protein